MADFTALWTLREGPLFDSVRQRIGVALVAATRPFLMDPVDAKRAAFALRVLADPLTAAGGAYFAVLTSTAILAKLDTPNQITDADLVASAAEIVGGLAEGLR